MKTQDLTLFRRLPALATAHDRRGRFVVVSDAFAQRLGFDPSHFAGLGPADIATAESARRIAEEYRPILRRTGLLDTTPVEFVGADGQPVALVVKSAASRQQGVPTVSVYFETDETERIGRKFIDLFRATPTMLHVMDAQARILDVSDRWLRKLGYRRDQVIGRDLGDFLTASNIDDIVEGRLLPLIHATEQTNQPRQMVKRNGDVIDVLMSASLGRDDSGEIERVFVASKDVTEANRARRQLQDAFEENARLRRKLERERDYLREEVNVSMNFGRIIGSSPALKRMLAQIEAVASTPASVLLLGESGTGKELVAHAIHGASDRADGPLVKVNCAAIPDELFESEFFGHVRGAFTGANRDRIGRFQLASGGTLFLDEVGEIPLELQGKLLRVLQERQFERVGGDATIDADVRVVAASNRNLHAQVKAGLFREDLFYRLSVFPIDVPPLRERGDDVAQLAAHFLDELGRDFGRTPPALSEQQVGQLRAYNWPGNVRELKNVLERAVILARGGKLALDPRLRADSDAGDSNLPAADATVTRTRILTDADIKALQKRHTRLALEQCGWRVAGDKGAAALLGVRPTTLADRIRSWGIARHQAPDDSA